MQATSRRHLLLLAALAAGVPRAQAAPPIQVEGYTFAGQARVADTALELNGVGYRAVAWLKGYAAGLYLPRRATTAAQVLAMPGPKRLQLRMLLDVETEEFVKAFDKGVARNTPSADVARLAERMARFDAQLRALRKVAKRDLIDLDFIPGTGLQLSLNGKPRGEPLPGEDLYAALLRIFIGDKPTDPELKLGLLGGPVA
ncbi:MAG TPA: chalcone isomerase family protein [Burkholderiaceae bacterium]|nr:chalcone isomerase family protein [Burkholderiaceae bacterium]